MYFVFYCVILSVCFLQSNGLIEGERCIKNGAQGVCRQMSQCPSTIQDVLNNKWPQKCNLKDDSVVCCVTSTYQESPTTKATTTTEKYYDSEDYESDDCPPIDPSLTASKTGRKAWDKCVEYQDKYVYPCELDYVAFNVFDTYHRVSKCMHGGTPNIVAGEDAKEGEFPHMALLGYPAIDGNGIEFSCGGSVISENFILTAGHCTYTRLSQPVTYALLGTLRRSDNYQPENLYTIANIIKHPDYAPPIRYHDIALLETDRPIIMSKYVIPACLDVGMQTANSAIATGWGATNFGKANADILQKVNLTNLGLDCFLHYRPGRDLTFGFDIKTQLCYGDRTKASDTCGGDSGGPLQIYSTHLNCMYVVVGVTSFGLDCGHMDVPAIYTNVQEYVPWIESIVWP